MAEKPKSEDKPLVRSGVKTFLRFFICGPSTDAGWVLWALLLPITLPIWMVCQFIIGDGGGGHEGRIFTIECANQKFCTSAVIYSTGIRFYL